MAKSFIVKIISLCCAGLMAVAGFANRLAYIDETDIRYLVYHASEWGVVLVGYLCACAIYSLSKKFVVKNGKLPSHPKN